MSNECFSADVELPHGISMYMAEPWQTSGISIYFMSFWSFSSCPSSSK